MLEKGALIERFFYTPDGAANSEEEDWPGLYQFESSYRHLNKEDIGYPRRFVSRFLRENDIYIPYLPYFWYRFRVGERVNLQTVAEAEIHFERVDYLVVSKRPNQ